VRDTSRNPVFQVMFVLQNWPLSFPVFPGLHVAREPVDHGVAQYDLTLDIVELQGELTATLEYSTDLFVATTIERMAGHLLTLLAGIVADPQQPITQIPLLTPGERRSMLVEWNRTEVPYPTGQCVHDLVEAQARRTPHAVAVECGQAQLTYAELDQRANQLAR
jgi:non-ribosomal peptide synthetase component F